MWPADKLSIIQTACLQTGNNPPNVAEDGSEEWDHGSTAYELALPYAIEGRDWKFVTTIATLTASGTPPTDPQYDKTYAKPEDLAHLIWVKVNDMPANYEVVGNQIFLNNTGSLTVTAKYVRLTSTDIAEATPSFVLGLANLVMSGIYRGLNEDIGQAERMWAMGEGILARAASRSDQEQPKRAIFSSRLAMARRVGRPWPRNPGGWGQAGA